MSKADLSTLCQQIAVSARHMQYLLDEIHRHIPKVMVWAFGSRVTGQHRPASDLDLAIHCDKETARKDLPALNEVLIESDLPFKVQILDFNRLPENMQATIKTKYIVLCQPQEETSERKNRKTSFLSKLILSVFVFDTIIFGLISCLLYSKQNPFPAFFFFVITLLLNFGTCGSIFMVSIFLKKEKRKDESSKY